jgi:hypothetical protein
MTRDLILGFAIAALALYAGIVTIQHNRLEEVYQTTMQSAIANAIEAQERAKVAERKYLAAHTAHKLIACESNGNGKARSYKKDIFGYARGWAQWKDATWAEAINRHGCPNCKINDYGDHWTMFKELMADRGHQWACCRNDPVCAENFVREGR